MKILSLLLSFLIVASPLAAGETPWQEVMPDVSVRLVSTDTITENGTMWLALEIDMPETMKTYWRIPGESGIPPQFDFTGSNDIGVHTIAWPYPTRSETDAYLDHAYYGRTVLPVEIEVTGNDPAVALNAVLGVCSDVCVPVSADFALSLDADSPDRANVLRVQQARAEVPIAWTGEDIIGDVRLLAHEGVLIAELETNDFPAHTAIADIAGAALLFGPPEHDEATRTLRFPLLGKAIAKPGEGAQVHISFMGKDGPYEIVRTLGPSAL